MSQTVDIGAARVRLIVDADDFEAQVRSGKVAIRGFGQEAQQAYDRTDRATRRAADSLLDYVHGLGSADASMTRYITKASKLGVEKSIIDQAVAAWARHEAVLSENEYAIERTRVGNEKLAAAADKVAKAQREAAAAATLADTEYALERARVGNEKLAAAADKVAKAQREAATASALAENEYALERARIGNEKLAAAADKVAKAQREASAASALADNEYALERARVGNEKLAAAADKAAKAQREAATAAALADNEYALERARIGNEKLAAAADKAAKAQRESAEASALYESEYALERARVGNEKLAAAADKAAKAQREAATAAALYENEYALERARIGNEKLAVAADKAAKAQREAAEASALYENEYALERARVGNEKLAAAADKAAKAQREAAQTQASGDAYIKQLQNTEVAAGKTYYELLRLKAAELGVADAAAPIIAKIEAQNQAMGRGTVSAKQYALAVRQLPAQFTDVFTSLVAGQNPLLVLLQQGGQVKDMFGGVKAAIGAVAKESLLLLKNPYVLLAAAIATVAVAAYQADTRITALAVSAAKGNGIAGTARQLSLYAEQLNGLANINLSGADAAVSKLAEGGRLAGENFRLAAEAAARWATVTGEAVDDVAGKFEAIARDPMAAVLDGTVKITSAQYDQIRALIEAGDQAKAVTELVKIYYDQINDNSQTVVNNLSAVTREWRDIKDSVTSAWHETQQYFEYLLGAGLKAQERFNALPWYTKLAPGSGILATLRGLADQTAGERVGTEKGRRADPMTTGGESAKLSRLQITANEDLAKSWDNSGAKAERLKAKVDKLNATLRNATDSALAQRDIVRGPNGTFSGKGYDRLVKALDDKTKGPKTAPQGPDPTKEIQEREKTALAQLRKVQQEFDYVYADRESTIESYYAKSVFLAREEADVQIKSNNEQIAALKGRRDSEDKIAALEQQNNTINEQFAAKKAKLDREEVLATRQRTDALRDYLQALTDANAQLAQGFAQSTRAVGRGGRNPEMLNALDGVLTDSNRRLRAIDNDRSLTDSEAADRRATEYDALAEKQLIIVQGYANIREAESNWLNGATKSWEDWLQQVGDIATQVGSITTSAMNGMVDSISSKIRTGSSGFKSYLDDLNRQILDFVLKQQLTKFFKSIGEAGAGTDWGSAVMKFGSALFGTASAQGNVFGGGVLANYRNSIVSQPTYFPFAKGGVPNVGLMGERSGKPHEAIMPLTRTAGGDLGVKVVGQGQQRTTNISQTFIVPGVADRTTRDQLAIKTLGAAQRAARRA